MSTAMNFGSKSFQPRPPDKGSFPLDHFGECKSFKEKFMKCLRDNNFENTLCRNESKEYLECRMEREPSLAEALSEDRLTKSNPFWACFQFFLNKLRRSPPGKLRCASWTPGS
nr:cytochrome c oxidase assembly protein COX19 isoform X2 [Odocoileus virginianus texanus]